MSLKSLFSGLFTTRANTVTNQQNRTDTQNVQQQQILDGLTITYSGQQTRSYQVAVPHYSGLTAVPSNDPLCNKIYSAQWAVEQGKANQKFLDSMDPFIQNLSKDILNRLANRFLYTDPFLDKQLEIANIIKKHLTIRDFKNKLESIIEE